MSSAADSELTRAAKRLYMETFYQYNNMADEFRDWRLEPITERNRPDGCSNMFYNRTVGINT